MGGSRRRFRAVTRAAVDSHFRIRLKELWAHSTHQALPTCGMASVQRAELTFQVIKAEIGRMSSLRHVREGLKAADHHLRQESKRQVAHCRECNLAHPGDNRRETRLPVRITMGMLRKRDPLDTLFDYLCPFLLKRHSSVQCVRIVSLGSLSGVKK